MSQTLPSQVHCYLCHADLYACDRCDGCGRQVVVRYEPIPGETYCDDCLDEAGDRYMEMLNEQRLGR